MIDAATLTAHGYRYCGQYSHKVRGFGRGPTLWQKKLAEDRFVDFWDWRELYHDLHPNMHWEAEVCLNHAQPGDCAMRVQFYAGDLDVDAIEAAALRLFNDWEVPHNDVDEGEKEKVT